MSFLRTSLFLSLAALLACSPALATTTAHPGATHSKATHKLASHSKKRPHKLHGQQAIDSERVTQIQQALIREHYLTSDASGQWDSATQAAMQKYQADHGWQTRLMPDSRALKTLGLGPDYSTAINARDAAATPSAPAAPIPAAQATGFAAASGINR